MTDKHWYPRYVGDYARDTSHLTLAEHGAYTLLLDHYYSMKGKLPASAVHLHRICRAFAPEEQHAVDSVVQQFFSMEGEMLKNSRADKELRKRGEISEKRAHAANLRHSKCNANASVLHDTATATATKSPSQEEETLSSTQYASTRTTGAACGIDDPFGGDYEAA